MKSHVHQLAYLILNVLTHLISNVFHGVLGFEEFLYEFSVNFFARE